MSACYVNPTNSWAHCFTFCILLLLFYLFTGKASRSSHCSLFLFQRCCLCKPVRRHTNYRVQGMGITMTALGSKSACTVRKKALLGRRLLNSRQLLILNSPLAIRHKTPLILQPPATLLLIIESGSSTEMWEMSKIIWCQYFLNMQCTKAHLIHMSTKYGNYISPQRQLRGVIRLWKKWVSVEHHKRGLMLQPVGPVYSTIYSTSGHKKVQFDHDISYATPSDKHSPISSLPFT